MRLVYPSNIRLGDSVNVGFPSAQLLYSTLFDSPVRLRVLLSRPSFPLAEQPFPFTFIFTPLQIRLCYPPPVHYGSNGTPQPSF